MSWHQGIRNHVPAIRWELYGYCGKLCQVMRYLPKDSNKFEKFDFYFLGLSFYNYLLPENKINFERKRDSGINSLYFK